MPTLALTNYRVCPPDGFRYVFPEDGYVSHAWTHDAWIADGAAHCQANNYDIPDLAERMEEQLCKTLPPGWCNYDDPNRARPSTVMHWDDVLRGTKQMATWVAGGMQYASQEESERRALICSRCYLNVYVSGCAACHALVETVVKDVKTKSDAHLKACAVCKCLLRAKVHFPMEVLDKENARVQELYPEHCWLNKQSENYRG
jgi:hypothetical protein